MLPIRPPSAAALGLAAFAFGTAIGLTGGSVAAGTGVVLAVIAVRRGGARVAAAAVLIGTFHGVAGRSFDRLRCPAVLAAGALELDLVFVEPGLPNRRVLAVPFAGCPGTITVRHRLPDTLWAGSRIRAEGRWVPRSTQWGPADGLFAIRTVRQLATPGLSLSARLRNWLSRQIGKLYGDRSGIVEALVLGSRGSIDPALAQAFARSGLVHLLSISGFHVGLVWAWVLLIAGLVGRRRQAPGIAALVVVCYVIFLGLPPPAVRSMMLALLAALQVRRQRNVAVGALSAVVAALVLLVDPWALADLGAWLSVAAMWGAIAAGRWSERTIGISAGWTLFASSAGATLATGPLSALVFGSISLVGVGLGLVAIPLTAVALPAVLLSLVVSGTWWGGAAALAAGAGSLLNALEAIAVRGGVLPGAALMFEPGPLPALLAAGVLGLAVWVFGTRNRLTEVRRRAAWLGAAALTGSLGLGWWAERRDGSAPTLHFLDVGQGDALLIRSGRGQWILVDAGPADERGDAGRRVVLPFLQRRGVRQLAGGVMSHAHRDHFGGLPAVLATVDAAIVADPGVPVPDRGYLDLLDQVDDRAQPWRALRSGDRLRVDDVALEVLHPEPSWPGWGVDLNENSLVLHLTIGAFDALLTGDAGFPVEEWIGSRLGPMELLKVGHHGSRTATGADFLARVRPTIAVVSVGVNRYGHPSPEVLARLAAGNVPVWRTDLEGTVSVAIEPTRMRVRSRRGEVILPLYQ